MTKYDAPDSFEVLHMRFMSLLCRLQTLDGVLGNGALLPIELQPAAYCFAETVKEVAQLYEDFEAWYPPPRPGSTPRDPNCGDRARHLHPLRRRGLRLVRTRGGPDSPAGSSCCLTDAKHPAPSGRAFSGGQ